MDWRSFDKSLGQIRLRLSKRRDGVESPRAVVNTALQLIGQLAARELPNLPPMSSGRRWTHVEVVGRLTTRWLWLRAREEILLVSAALLGRAVTSACSRYAWANPHVVLRGVQSQPDWKTYAQEMLAEILIWLAEPSKPNEETRYHQILSSYERWLQRHPNRPADPVRRLGDMCRKRIHRSLNGWYSCGIWPFATSKSVSFEETLAGVS